jgi:hypothetical protein
MENNFNVDGMSGFGIINLKKIKNCEAELIDVAEKVGVNNRLEIFDAELIERYIYLKNEMKILTYNFLY